jgi:hypothetical protein
MKKQACHLHLPLFLKEHGMMKHWLANRLEEVVGMFVGKLLPFLGFVVAVMP